MDLTTLTLFLALIMSAVGADTMLHPTSVVLDATVAGKLDKISIDAATLEEMLTYEVTQVVATPSVLTAPEIRPSAKEGIGMALAQTVKLGEVALALQAQIGYEPERIKLTLLGEEGAIRMLITGSGMGGRIHTPPFMEQITLNPGEEIRAFVHRASLRGMAKIDPYITSLYLLHSHIPENDFTEAEALIKLTKQQLPQTPINFDRSVFENLQGMIELLRGNEDQADAWFHTAIASDPTDAAADLNAAFLDFRRGNYQDTVDHVQILLTEKPLPRDNTLLSAAYLTSGAALLRLNRLDEADRQLARAIEIDPTSTMAYDVWSHVKRAKGETAKADELQTRAWQLADPTESYAEVAALQFGLIGKPGDKLIQSPLASPTNLRFN